MTAATSTQRSRKNGRANADATIDEVSERAFLGAMLTAARTGDSNTLAKLAIVREHHFAHAAFAQLHAALNAIIADGKRPDATALARALPVGTMPGTNLSAREIVTDCLKAAPHGDVGDLAGYLVEIATERSYRLISEDVQAGRLSPADAELRREEIARERHEALRDNNRITAQPYRYRPATDIPSRDILYGQEIRGLTSTTVGRPGVGKTKLIIGETLSKVVGRQLLQETPRDQYRCWVWFGEECADDIDRLLTAAMDHHGITDAEIGDRLFVSSRDQRLVIATQTRDGLVIARPQVDAVKRFLRENRIDSVTIDPFVKSHQVGENDNVLIDKVVGVWGEIAHECRVHVHLYHHNRKTGGADLTVEDVRGGGAIVGAVRSVRILNAMTKDDAEKAEVDPAWAYVRLDDAKQNNLPPAKARWMRLVSVDLAHGDTAGVATAWSWPDPFSEISREDTRRVQKRIADGEWRASSQAADWVGKAIAEVLGLDVTDKDARTHVKTLVKTWIEHGVLKKVDRKDDTRHARAYVEVGEWM